MITFVVVYLFVSSPPFFPVDPETASDAQVIDYFTVEDLALAVEQTGKHPLFEHSDIAHSLLSHACTRIAAATALPILMHSLFIVTYLLPTAYPKLLSLGWVETI